MSTALELPRFDRPRVGALFAFRATRPVLWGDLAAVPLGDILHLLSQSRQSGVLVVRDPAGTEHALALSQGALAWTDSAASEDPIALTGRLLAAPAGMFAFLRAPASQLEEGPDGLPILPLPIDRLLLAAMRDDSGAPAVLLAS